MEGERQQGGRKMNEGRETARREEDEWRERDSEEGGRKVWREGRSKEEDGKSLFPARNTHSFS